MINNELARLRELYRNRWKYHAGYIWAFNMGDGETLCFACAKENLRSLIDACFPGGDICWRADSIFNVSESETMEQCSHCNKVLKSWEECQE